MPRDTFIKRMDAEIEISTCGYKELWAEWKPTPLEAQTALRSYAEQLLRMLAATGTVTEYSDQRGRYVMEAAARLANLCDKISEVYGGGEPSDDIEATLPLLRELVARHTQSNG